LAEHLMIMGRLPEVIARARMAVQLDPLAPAANNVLGVALLFAGRTDEAIAVLRAAVVRDSTAGLMWRNLVRSYIEAGREDDALALLAGLRDTSTFWRAAVRARSDPRARAAALDALGRPGGLRAVGGSHAVASRLYAYLGAREAALAELERAAGERDPRLEFMKIDPAWASVRSDPRFAAVLAQIGLPP
jgi:tetratricopeptide (TPR) repeat protein